MVKQSHKKKFIDSFWFMARSLTSLVDNLSEGLHKDKCIDCKSCLDYMIFKDNLSVKRITKKKLIKT